jgi:hypothetical protein
MIDPFPEGIGRIRACDGDAMSTRRGFLALLLGLPAVPLARTAPLARAAPAHEPRRYVLNDCFIAGFQYHDGSHLLGRLEVGTELSAVAEPWNPHDHRAVRLELDGTHIGYLPRDQNRAVAELLAQRAPVRCAVTAVSESAPPWEAVRIRTSIAAVA